MQTYKSDNYEILEQRRRLIRNRFKAKESTYPYNAILAAGIKGIISDDQVKAFEAIMLSIEVEYQNAIIAHFRDNKRVQSRLLKEALVELTKGNYLDILTLGLSFFPETRCVIRYSNLPIQMSELSQS